MRLLVLNASNQREIDLAFTTLLAERVGLLLVSGDSVLVSLRNDIVALAARHAVPTLYHRREFARAGGLMSLGPSLAEAYYQIGDYVGRILKARSRSIYRCSSRPNSNWRLISKRQKHLA